MEWFTKQYSLKVVSELGLSGNNINRDFYIQTGKSLFVLCDEFLEDKEDIHKDAKRRMKSVCYLQEIYALRKMVLY